MTLTIQIPPEIESRLKGEAARLGLDEAELAIRAIERSLPPNQQPADHEWQARFDAMLSQAREMARSNLPAGYAADDSREIIYQGRGE